MSMAVFLPAAIFFLPLLVAAQTASPPPPTDASPSRPTNEHQLNNIIDALIGSGDFAGWVNLLSSTDPSTIPVTATLFIPSNDAVSHFPAFSAAGIVPFDPLLVPYHIVPQRLTFADLQHFSTHTRLPTLVPLKYIVITNNSPSNFTVDDSRITQADIFVSATFSVHGIEKVLDYSVFGNSGPVISEPPPRPKAIPVQPNGNRPGFSREGTRSGATCLSGEILMFFAATCAAVALV